jgi:DeoR/GlpR family transcriptional regulator of sugar metabolism
VAELKVASGISNLGAVSGRKAVRQRLSRILECLAAGERVRVEELIQGTGMSAATLRRDLRRLQSGGLVRRDHGGVSIAESRAFEAFLYDPSFRDQVQHLSSEKRRIGNAAAGLVKDGQTIAIAPGTTTAQIARAMQPHTGLTIVTNAVNVAMDLSRRKDITIHLTGGYLSGDWFAMVGPRALEFIRSVFPAQFFFGANGVDARHGVTDRHAEETAVNQAMAEQAQKRILVVDHTKLGKVAGHLVCPISKLDVIITDTGAPDAIIAPFLKLGIEVMRV